MVLLWWTNSTSPWTRTPIERVRRGMIRLCVSMPICYQVLLDSGLWACFSLSLSLQLSLSLSFSLALSIKLSFSVIYSQVGKIRGWSNTHTHTHTHTQQQQPKTTCIWSKQTELLKGGKQIFFCKNSTIIWKLNLKGGDYKKRLTREGTVEEK